MGLPEFLSYGIFSPFHTTKLFWPDRIVFLFMTKIKKNQPRLKLAHWWLRWKGPKKKKEWICPCIQYCVLSMPQCWGYNVFYHCILVDQCWVDQLKSTLNSTGQPDWRQTLPLTEDINLWQFSPLTEAHAGIEFTSKRRGQLSDIQEVLGDAADEL